MNNNIKEIAEKFLAEEKIPTKTAILMASLGLNKSAGDIADIAYGVNFNQHAYNEERQRQMIEYLGYTMLNWQILALSTGVSADEIAKRFSAEWMTRHAGKVSIKDLLKHLKPNALSVDALASNKSTSEKFTQAIAGKTPEQNRDEEKNSARETAKADFMSQL